MTFTNNMKTTLSYFFLIPALPSLALSKSKTEGRLLLNAVEAPTGCSAAALPAERGPARVDLPLRNRESWASIGTW